MGCKKRVAYSSFTYPEGARDALSLFVNPHGYGGAIKCQPKEVFAKVFGYAQNYDALTDAKAVATKIRSAGGSKTEKIIIDWKHTGDNLSKTREFLDSLL